MNANGVTHIMFHPQRWGHEAPKAIEIMSKQPDLELMAVDEKTGIRLYRYKPRRDFKRSRGARSSQGR